MFSKTTNYALRAIAYLAGLYPDYKADSTEIATATHTPRRFLLKILTSLKFHKILTSGRGIGGGFRLSKDPASISLYEVVIIFEDIDHLDSCPLGNNCSDNAGCPIHHDWYQVYDAYNTYLKNTSFESFHEMRYKDRLTDQD